MTLDLDADFLKPRPANHRPLTPLNFLFRAADAFGDRTAVIHGDVRYTWREHAERCRRLASALKRAGIGPGDVVSVLAPNTPAMLEAHFGVPLSGAVLNTLNIRLDAAALAFIVTHCEAKALLVDRQFSALSRDVLAKLPQKPLVIDIEDAYAEGGDLIGDTTYEAFLATGDPDDPVHWPDDEFDAIYGRIVAAGMTHWADPAGTRVGEINHNDGGRGVYFRDPDGHHLEILTRPYEN